MFSVDGELFDEVSKSWVGGEDSLDVGETKPIPPKVAYWKTRSANFKKHLKKDSEADLKSDIARCLTHFSNATPLSDPERRLGGTKSLWALLTNTPQCLLPARHPQ
jgi:hypothetical protein